MKVLRSVLDHEGIDRSTLRPLFEQDGQTTYALTVGGDDAVNLWERLRALAPDTGRWPLLVGNPGEEDLPTQRMIWSAGTGEQVERFPRFRTILKAAEKIDARALLDGWHTRHLESIQEQLAEAEESGDEDEIDHWRSLLKGPENLRGIEREDWPEDAEPTSPWSIATSMTHDENLVRQVTLALLPVERGWEAPAVLKFGGWNECPKPADHVAVLRYWHEQYGAEVVAITNDTVEMMVARPPRSKKAALMLARDQYHYCPDVVEQGRDTLDALAGGLLRGEAWFFWWD